MNYNFFFVKEFVDLIRKDQRLDAVKHARKHFPNFEFEQLKEIRQCMGLLAYPVNTKIEPYKSLLDETRWEDLILSFRLENYRLFQLASNSVLNVAVQVISLFLFMFSNLIFRF